MNTVEKMREALSGLANMVSKVLTDSQLDHDHSGATIRAAYAPVREVLAACTDPTDSEMESRAKFRTTELEKRAEELHLAVILYSRRPSRTYLVALDAAQLQKIGRAVSVLAVKQCNVGLSEADEKRWDRLTAQANEIAAWYGLSATAHGDPRGYVLRLHGDGLELNGWGDGFGVA